MEFTIQTDEIKPIAVASLSSTQRHLNKLQDDLTDPDNEDHADQIQADIDRIQVRISDLEEIVAATSSTIQMNSAMLHGLATGSFVGWPE